MVESADTRDLKSLDSDIVPVQVRSAAPKTKGKKDLLLTKPVNPSLSVHKEVFSYERLVATSVMEAAAFSLSVVDHGLDDSAIASISFMVARSTSPTPVK